MSYKTKGIITAIGEVTPTKTGVARQQLHFEQEDGKTFYPTALGKKIELLSLLLPGDVCELEFHISGHKQMFNHVVINNIKKI